MPPSSVKGEMPGTSEYEGLGFYRRKLPFGYKKVSDNCHKLLVNEDTAPIVRQIFEWKGHGTGLNEIVKRLNEKGILTPSHYLASVGII